jgi:hypothetical protein
VMLSQLSGFLRRSRSRSVRTNSSRANARGDAR